MDIVLILLEGAVVTLKIAVGSWILSIVLGLLLGAIHDLGSGVARGIVHAVVTVLRSMPQLVVLYLLYFGIGAFGLNVPPTIAAVLALGVTDAAFTSEYYRAALMTVSPSQREAGASIGLSPFGVFRRVVLPQALPFAVPPILNSFISLLKVATLAAAVGSPEILYRAQSLMQVTGEITIVITIVIALYIGITVPLSRAVGVLERRIGASSRST